MLKRLSASTCPWLDNESIVVFLLAPLVHKLVNSLWVYDLP